MDAELAMLAGWVVVMLLVASQIYAWHSHPDAFDARQFITSPDAAGRERPDLSKLILVIAMLCSVYVLVKDANDAGGVRAEVFGLFLGAWVLNKMVSTGARVLPALLGKESEPKRDSNVST